MMRSQPAIAPGHEADAVRLATLELKNNWHRPVEVRLGGDETQWKLDVQGPTAGIARKPVPKEEISALFPKESLRLEPG